MIGAIFGRWWRVTLLVSAVGWPILLAATGAMSVGPALLGVSGHAVLNTGAGVLFHQIILRGGRRLRRAMASRRKQLTLPPANSFIGNGCHVPAAGHIGRRSAGR